MSKNFQLSKNQTFFKIKKKKKKKETLKNKPMIFF